VVLPVLGNIDSYDQFTVAGILNEVSSPSGIYNISRFWSSCLDTLCFLLLKTVLIIWISKLLLWTYLMKVIPETHRYVKW